MTATKEDFHAGELVEVSAEYTDCMEELFGIERGRLAMVMPRKAVGILSWETISRDFVTNVYVIYPDGKNTFIPPHKLKKIA